MEQTATFTPDGSEYAAWMIRNAARHNLTSSDYHPDAIRAEIARLRQLLKLANINHKRHEN